MTPTRTVKTLAYLVSAMTAVTLALSLLEPWTVSLRPQEARAGQEVRPTTLSAARPPHWQSLELVVAAQEPGKAFHLPPTHVIIRPNGLVENTHLWDLGQPLANNVLRVCALYQGRPTEEMLRSWMKVCEQANRHFNTDIHGIRLKTMPQTHSDPAQARILAGIQRQLHAFLASR